MVHAARRDLHLVAFDAKHRADMFAVRSLYLHVLFDLRSFDRGDYLLPLIVLPRTTTCQGAPTTNASDRWRASVTFTAQDNTFSIKHSRYGAWSGFDRMKSETGKSAP